MKINAFLLTIIFSLDEGLRYFTDASDKSFNRTFFLSPEHILFYNYMCYTIKKHVYL